MARVFMSYRRDESSGHAGRLADRLRTHFGREQVFLDVDLAPGVEFAEHIRTAVAQCDALIVVIGPGWATVENPEGTRRLDDPDDLVRVEVETALTHPGVTTIPVLVEGATMPRPSDLPLPLRPLVSRNALEITDTRFDYDTGRLVDTLQRFAPAETVEPPPTRRRRSKRKQVLAAAGLTVVALAIAAYLLLVPKQVVVPDVVGASSAFDAEATLNDAGLDLSPQVKRKVDTKARPGTVIGQTPSADAKVDKGTQVTVLIAAERGQIRVPNVVGERVSDAETALRGKGLTLGRVSPRDFDPAGKISSQDPLPNETVKSGTRVDVDVRAASG